MTTTEAARELGVTRQRVDQLVRDDLLRHMRIGAILLVARDDVQKRKASSPKPGRRPR